MTKELFDPLDNKELERLDRLLFDRVDEDAVTEGMDEGVLNISELDGMFTAILSSPDLIMPSQWLPLVWGDFEPEWDSEKEFTDNLSLMLRHMNGIADILIEHPDEFEPIYLQNEIEGGAHAIVDDWCEGYMRGVAMASEEWEAGGLEIRKLLSPIQAFSSVSDWCAHDAINEAGVEDIRNAIIPHVREIHAFWLARRERAGPLVPTVQRKKPRVGRNDPCPCGSGKKYKKCCLH